MNAVHSEQALPIQPTAEINVSRLLNGKEKSYQKMVLKQLDQQYEKKDPISYITINLR